MEDVPGVSTPPSCTSSANAPRAVWLTLALAIPLTPTRCQRLRERYPDPARLGRLLVALLGSDRSAAKAAARQLTAPAGPLSANHVDALRLPATRARVEACLRWLDQAPDRHLITADDTLYPVRLWATGDPPPVLFLRGSRAVLEGPAVGIVGSRKASQGGRETARAMGAGLAAAGLVVVSGLALGADAEAHAGALQAKGLTLAFMATGIDEVYPRRHARLAAAIVESGGALVSEFPLRHPPQPWCFPQRNRLISGISEGIVVVEAALPSGTLTTARHALDQGRDVMAVPGSIRSPGTAGCHALMREGGIVVTSVNEVLLQLSASLCNAIVASRDASGGEDGKASRIHSPPIGDDADESQVWQCLEFDSLSIEDVVARTGLAVTRTMQALGKLEIRGHIVRDSSGRYARCALAV